MLMRDEDGFTASGAKRIAAAITDYWRARGHNTVRAWIELVPTQSEGMPIYQVRSNLLNGLPPLAANPTPKNSNARAGKQNPAPLAGGTERRITT
jgi:hypothetical protein